MEEETRDLHVMNESLYKKLDDLRGVKQGCDKTMEALQTKVRPLIEHFVDYRFYLTQFIQVETELSRIREEYEALSGQTVDLRDALDVAQATANHLEDKCNGAEMALGQEKSAHVANIEKLKVKVIAHYLLCIVLLNIPGSGEEAGIGNRENGRHSAAVGERSRRQGWHYLVVMFSGNTN